MQLMAMVLLLMVVVKRASSRALPGVSCPQGLARRHLGKKRGMQRPKPVLLTVRGFGRHFGRPGERSRCVFGSGGRGGSDGGRLQDPSTRRWDLATDGDGRRRLDSGCLLDILQSASRCGLCSGGGGEAMDDEDDEIPLRDVS